MIIMKLVGHHLRFEITNTFGLGVLECQTISPLLLHLSLIAVGIPLACPLELVALMFVIYPLGLWLGEQLTYPPSITIPGTLAPISNIESLDFCAISESESNVFPFKFVCGHII
jgi:hypothetical protein